MKLTGVLKSMIILLLAFAVALPLSGCKDAYDVYMLAGDDKSVKYVRPLELNNYSYNYNNLSSRKYGSWIEISEDVIYYRDSSYWGGSFRYITKEGDFYLFNDGNNPMVIDGMLYYALENEIIEYDPISKNQRVLFKTEKQQIHYFFIIDGVIYMLLKPGTYWTDINKTDSKTSDDSDLCVFDIASGKTEKSPEWVFSLGVIDSRPAYIYRDGKEYVLRFYNGDVIGRFNMPVDSVIKKVSYTSYGIIIEGEACFVVYNYLDDRVEVCNTDFEIGDFVAYDKYLYMTDEHNVYRYCIETQALGTVCTVDDAAYPNIYVISDTEVCVILSMDDIRLYHPDGTYEKLTKRVQNPNSALTKGALT